MKHKRNLWLSGIIATLIFIGVIQPFKSLRTKQLQFSTTATASASAIPQSITTGISGGTTVDPNSEPVFDILHEPAFPHDPVLSWEVITITPGMTLWGIGVRSPDQYDGPALIYPGEQFVKVFKKSGKIFFYKNTPDRYCLQ